MLRAKPSTTVAKPNQAAEDERDSLSRRIFLIVGGSLVLILVVGVCGFLFSSRSPSDAPVSQVAFDLQKTTLSSSVSLKASTLMKSPVKFMSAALKTRTIPAVMALVVTLLIVCSVVVAFVVSKQETEPVIIEEHLEDPENLEDRDTDHMEKSFYESVLGYSKLFGGILAVVFFIIVCTIIWSKIGKSKPNDDSSTQPEPENDSIGQNSNEYQPPDPNQNVLSSPNNNNSQPLNLNQNVPETDGTPETVVKTPVVQAENNGNHTEETKSLTSTKPIKHTPFTASESTDEPEDSAQNKPPTETAKTDEEPLVSVAPNTQTDSTLPEKTSSSTTPPRRLTQEDLEPLPKMGKKLADQVSALMVATLFLEDVNSLNENALENGKMHLVAFQPSDGYIQLKGIKGDVYFPVDGMTPRLCQHVVLQAGQQSLVLGFRQRQRLEPDEPLKDGDELHLIEMSEKRLEMFEDRRLDDLIEYCTKLSYQWFG